MNRSFAPVRSAPFMTRTELTTPRYWSKCESKMSAWSGASSSPSGGGIRSITASSSSGTPSPVFAEIAQDVVGGDAEHPLDLGRVAVGLGGGQVDLVEAGDDLEVVLERQVAVGQRLGLDALRRVDDEDHALARGERPRHLVAEVDVAGRVDDVDDVVAVVEADRLQLDRDAALALEVHRVEVLLAHVAGVDGAADLEDAIGQRRLAVVDVGDDREVADAGEVGHNSPDATDRRARRSQRHEQ